MSLVTRFPVWRASEKLDTKRGSDNFRNARPIRVVPRARAAISLNTARERKNRCYTRGERTRDLFSGSEGGCLATGLHNCKNERVQRLGPLRYPRCSPTEMGHAKQARSVRSGLLDSTHILLVHSIRLLLIQHVIKL